MENVSEGLNIHDSQFWESIQLVVFDVDGTLYAQRPLRIRMLAALIADALSSRSLEVIIVLKHFRRIREEFGDQGIENFESTLLERTSEATGRPPERIKQIVHEWIERRPLAHLNASKYPGVTHVFETLRAKGIKIGVFSDYPALEKLKAMQLAADLVVSAVDPEIQRLKPNPRGLIQLMERAGSTPATTLMIGDRVDRDGEAAHRAGTLCLIRSQKSSSGWRCFRGYDQAPFSLLKKTRGPEALPVQESTPMKNLAVWIILALMLVSLSLGIVILTLLQR